MNKEQECLYCGCTEENPCEGGCSWITPELCSSCADLFRSEIDWVKALKKIKEKTAREISVKLWDDFEISGSNLSRADEEYNKGIEEIYEWILDNFTEKKYGGKNN